MIRLHAKLNCHSGRNAAKCGNPYFSHGFPLDFTLAKAGAGMTGFVFGKHKQLCDKSIYNYTNKD